jgi:CDGSH-type Zn-finger protein/uncharacterized Fe-S cluster protein YjdI
MVDAAIELMYVVTKVASALTALPASLEHPDCTAGMSFATVRGYAALPTGAISDRVLLERLGEIAASAARLASEMPDGDDVARGMTEVRERLANALGAAAPAPPANTSPAATARSVPAPSAVPTAAATTTAALATAMSAASAAAALGAPLSAAAFAPAAAANGTAAANGAVGTNGNGAGAHGAPPAAATPTGARSIPPSTVIDGVEHVEGRALTLKYETKRCIHARHCVLGQPGVFIANVQGPWLDPDATSTEGLITVAHMCPSGAIRYARKDGGAEEAAPPVNLVQIRENGPLGLRAELILDGERIGYRATLCRCGASQNKPFCDGSHNAIAFSASGEPATRPSEPLAARGGPLDIRPQKNGPLVVRGNLEICAGTGRTVDRVTSARLCRCGGSANKPFCDGTHAINGFQS